MENFIETHPICFFNLFIWTHSMLKNTIWKYMLKNGKTVWKIVCNKHIFGNHAIMHPYCLEHSKLEIVHRSQINCVHRMIHQRRVCVCLYTVGWLFSTKSVWKIHGVWSFVRELSSPRRRPHIEEKGVRHDCDTTWCKNVHRKYVFETRVSKIFLRCTLCIVSRFTDKRNTLKMQYFEKYKWIGNACHWRYLCEWSCWLIVDALYHHCAPNWRTMHMLGANLWKIRAKAHQWPINKPSEQYRARHLQIHNENTCVLQFDMQNDYNIYWKFHWFIFHSWVQFGSF